MTTIEYGMLDELDWNDSMFHDCSGVEISDDWSMVAGYDSRDIYKDTDGDGDEELVDEYDKIATGESDEHRAFMHFSDRPTNMIIDACSSDSDWKAEPYNFTITIKVPDSTTTEEIYLTDPDPRDDDTDSTNDELGLLMDIISTTAGSVYTRIGAVLVDYMINSDAGGASVTGDSRAWEFDIPVEGGYDDLPRETSDDAEVAEAKIRTNCDIKGDYYTIYQPQYTFRTRYTDPTYCNCSNHYWKYKTTAPGYSGTAAFDGVESE